MHIHILGICGTFMGGIAALARQSGHTVTGCDQHVYPPMSTQLEKLGIVLHQGFDEEQIQRFGVSHHPGFCGSRISFRRRGPERLHPTEPPVELLRLTECSRS